MASTQQKMQIVDDTQRSPSLRCNKPFHECTEAVLQENYASLASQVFDVQKQAGSGRKSMSDEKERKYAAHPRES
jgi:hypothetical protein